MILDRLCDDPALWDTMQRQCQHACGGSLQLSDADAALGGPPCCDRVQHRQRTTGLRQKEGPASTPQPSHEHHDMPTKYL